MVEVRQAGRYAFTLRQWPVAAEKPLVAVRAKIAIAGKEKEMLVSSGSEEARLELDLSVGSFELQTFLYDEAGRASGAYFTDVALMKNNGPTKGTKKKK
jgi:hypothetical protein